MANSDLAALSEAFLEKSKALFDSINEWSRIRDPIARTAEGFARFAKGDQESESALGKACQRYHATRQELHTLGFRLAALMESASLDSTPVLEYLQWCGPPDEKLVRIVDRYSKKWRSVEVCLHRIVLKSRLPNASEPSLEDIVSRQSDALAERQKREQERLRDDARTEAIDQILRKLAGYSYHSANAEFDANAADLRSPEYCKPLAATMVESVERLAELGISLDLADRWESILRVPAAMESNQNFLDARAYAIDIYRHMLEPNAERESTSKAVTDLLLAAQRGDFWHILLDGVKRALPHEIVGRPVPSHSLWAAPAVQAADFAGDRQPYCTSFPNQLSDSKLAESTDPTSKDLISLDDVEWLMPSVKKKTLQNHKPPKPEIRRRGRQPGLYRYPDLVRWIRQEFPKHAASLPNTYAEAREILSLRSPDQSVQPGSLPA